MVRHLAHLDRALTDLVAGRIDPPRLVIEMPPRHGKSMLGSKYLSSWYLGTYPKRDVILTSASDDLAEAFSVESRDIIEEWGKPLFGVSIRDDARGRKHWRLEQGGSLRAAGTGGSIMGRGADLLITDDYFRNAEDALSETSRNHVHEWFMSTALTRLSPHGAVVVIATRWHPDDLIGRLLRDAAHGGQPYKRISFPAIAEHDDELGRKPGDALWPEQWPLSSLQSTKDGHYAAGYPWLWEALYQQHPPSNLRSEFDAAWFEGDIWYDELPLTGIVDRVMFLDPSLGKTEKSDYSAFIMVAIDTLGRMYVNASIERRNVSQMSTDAVSIGHQFKPFAFGIESNGFQELLCEPIADRSKAAGFMLPIVPVNNRTNKETRIRGLTEYLSKREFRFQRNSPGVQLLLEQLKAFPAGRHDDGPDALAGAKDMLYHRHFGGLAGTSPGSNPWDDFGGRGRA
jgi:predicted phage terminase large subunit-like protein